VLSVLFAATVVVSMAAAPSGNGFCSPDLASIGCPTVGNTGTQLDIGGSYTQPGTETDTVGWNPDAPPPPPVRLTPGERGSPDCAPDAEVCVPVYTDPAPEEDAEDEIPEVTLADLVSFVPAQPALSAEPAAAGIVGMPTNFVAAATEQQLTGALFGRPVIVRFTPVAYVFDYGDGSSGRSDTGGASWDALGQAQFTATPTSHAYAERGSYVSSVTVEYAPAVDFGDGWRPVAGVVTSTTGGYAVDIYELRTALVERTCTENPAGPGC
jgi:hypothetical protein